MTDEQYLCKDCKHSFVPIMSYIIWMGRNSFNMHCKKSYVEAEIVPNEVMGPKISEAHYQRCSTARLHLISDKEKDKNCGKDGRFWEPRNKKDLFKFIKKVSQ